MKVEWLRTVHVQFLFKSELLCYAKNVDSASFVSFRNNINVKLNLKMRVMKTRKNFNYQFSPVSVFRVIGVCSIERHEK